MLDNVYRSQTQLGWTNFNLLKQYFIILFPFSPCCISRLNLFINEIFQYWDNVQKIMDIVKSTSILMLIKNNVSNS